MKRVVKWVIGILFVVSVIFTFVYLWQKGQPQEKKYDIVSVTAGDTISNQLILSGTIKPRDEVSIKPQIAGIISKLLVKPGEEVKAGDVIAHITVVPEMGQVNNAESNLEQAKINYERVRRVYNRDKELYAKGLIATEEYEKSKAELAGLKIQLETAEQSLQIVRSGVSNRYSKQSSTLVRATISGKILSIPVKEGSSVIQANNFNEGTTIATIANMNHLIFQGDADETEVGKLSAGQEMRITVGAILGLKVQAFVEYISPQGVSSSGTTRFEVRGPLQGLSLEEIAKLRSGLSANADIVISKASNVLSIPELCVSYKGKSAFVQVVKSEEPFVTEERAVSLGLSDGSKVEVKSGLKKGEKIRGNEIGATL